ncbi:MAG: hypothetical protein JNM66_08725 [Bryobacterales bacterium]|nr:hypothetical protein [Bryobacterales bacterium]
MKILLDESAPHKLRLLVDSRHTVLTTWFRGWSGLKNGALLMAAEEDGFDLLITADQELSYQQNLAGRRIAILVLSTINWGVIRERTTDITAAIESIPSGGYLIVDIGHARS